nr:DegT/DnrJ/EryC1/StrS family aminotransferase [uncultured Aminipila sp.]
MERISIANPIFNGNEKKYLNECIDTGWISANGQFIHAFEEKFAKFCGTKYALACSNGTVTLHLILSALGIGPGDEVIMPTLTYIATANAVAYCGATPVFVDSEEDTWNINPKKIEEKITPNTKAIIPVHLYGLCANMSEIMKIANNYNIIVIEDAAEAHGAKWDENRSGSMGHVGSFSFFGNKIITSGEGGMIVTNDGALYKKMQCLRSQGVDPSKRYWHTVVGYNYRMTNMQAAVGLAQLENIEWHLEQRQRVAKLYKKHFEKLADLVIAQSVPENSKHVYWMNSIVFSDKVTKSRDEIMEEMERKNIEMRPLFYPMHIMPPYYDNTFSFPIAEKLSSRGINLPSHALLNEENIQYIVSCLEEIIK